MKIVIDTNVVASAIFFGGRPRQLLEELFRKHIDAVASPEILIEYPETFDELRKRYPDKPIRIPLLQIAASCKIVTPTQNFHVCRDPDDDKFIDCAVEGKCIYIVSGDKDLLSLEKIKDVEIVTVSEFFNRYMPEEE
ncbi:MAG: putative toxin-antitoxin system toxin component, PIN family [Oscillospiraceae bacterium]|nr:putative toxin-antitoxin system toxin component, PIN family [Oscillospiraceae bacterium]